MTDDFQNWMRAVWLSLIEPASMAQKVMATQFEMRDLWQALALMTVLNVLLLAGLQAISPAPIAFQDQMITLSPFGYAAIVGVFLFLFVFGVFYTGQFMGGVGTLHATLTLMVWFQVVSLVLEILQILLVLVSPGVGALFGMISMVGLLWCIVNFVDVLHGFDSRGKAAVVLLLAMVGTALAAGIVLMIIGVGPTGETT